MADVSPVAFGIFKAIKRKVIKTFRVPPKTDTSQLTKPTSFKAETFKPADVPKQTYGNRSQEATSTANRQKIIDANKAGSKAMDEANAAGSAATKKANAATRNTNRELVKSNAARRTSAIRNRALAGTGGGTAAYLMSGDATITPKPAPAPAPSTSSPTRTPVAPTPKKEFINWRDRPSRRDASKPFESKSSSSPAPSKNSGISTGSSSKSMSRKGGKVSVPNIRNSDVRGAFRKAGERTTTAMQATKSRYLAGQAKRAAKTESIAKTPEISKRYDLSPKEAGDKLLQTASSLFPKKPAPARKNPDAFTSRDLVGTDGMSAGEITKRFNTEGYTTPPKKELTRRPGETLTSFNMRKQRALNAERKADFLSKR